MPRELTELKQEIRNKPHSASFTSLQMNDTFNHFRSVSYFEALTNNSLSGSRKSGLNSYSSTHDVKQKMKIISNSTPCTPKKIEIQKYSTLPVSVSNNLSLSTKKTKSSSLSSFFRKLRPKFHRSSSGSKNPWIVIEFSPRDSENGSSDESDKSNHSLELAVQSKAQHFTSLKDLHENSTSSDFCNCALSNKRKEGTSSPRCNFGLFSNGHKHDSSQLHAKQKYKSEASIFFRLSPRQRLENVKQILKGISRRTKYHNSSSTHSLHSKTCGLNSGSYLKRECKTSSHTFSALSQYEDGLSQDPVFTFCRPRNDFLRGYRYSADCSSYLLKVPKSSSNASLSSIQEISVASRRAQPPKTLSLGSKAFHDQQSLNVYKKMASVESIGACSLDFEMSASENFLAKDLTASECTLQSASFTPSSKEYVKNKEEAQGVTNGGSFLADEQRLPNGSAQFPDGVNSGDKSECTVAEIKLPSYVGISCAISGYANYSRFCRSRDNSPARSSFRKSSFEPSMIEEMYSRDLHSLPFDDMRSTHRCARSHSDSNGVMHSIYTESRHVTISKQLQVPFKSSKKYTTEVTIANGQNLLTETSSDVTSNVLTNGHSSETHALAKEVGIVGTKSLVQQRIESLYGKAVCDQMTISSVKTSTKQKKINHVNGDAKSASSRNSLTKNHIGEVSPPVFRHLTKDFRKQLQGDISDDTKLNFSHETSKTVKKFQRNTDDASKSKETNGDLLQTNGVSHDECDRALTKTLAIIQDITPEHEEHSMENLRKEEARKPGFKFLNVVAEVKNKIQVQIIQWENELLNSNIPEEASGKIRVACGKANLLLTQKFEQFRELCKKNIEEDPTVPFYTTESDLAGFWDMVMLQVDDVNFTFKDIQAMKENNWEEIVSPKPVVTKTRKSLPGAISKSNPCTPKHSAKSAESARAREEARKLLLAAKKKGRQQNNSVDDAEIEIFTPSST